MKIVELQLNKRLLIVESEAEYFGCKYPNITRICKGSELTEDILRKYCKEVVTIHFTGRLTGGYDNGNGKPVTAMESFISAIESKGYHWGENESLKKYRHVANSRMFKEAESRTFHPEKCIICEIV